MFLTQSLLVVGMCVGVLSVSMGDAFDEGVRLYREGRYDEAKAFFVTYLEAHPTHPEALYYLGMVETDGLASQKHFRTVWMNHPTHPLADDALYAVAQYHYAKGYYVTAGRMFRDLERAYPESERADDASYWSASSYLAALGPDSALTEWKRFLSTYPRSELYDWAVLGIGNALFASEKYGEARSEFAKIVESAFAQELKGTALYRVGQCHEYLGDTMSARACYERIGEEFPDSFEQFLIEGSWVRRPTTVEDTVAQFTIQVGAFAHKENAIKLHDLLSHKGYEVEIVTKSKEDGMFLHTVRVGSYASREEAEATAAHLEKEEGFKPRILLKSVQ